MARFEGNEVTILRNAGRNDPGYDGRYEQVWIGTEAGERMVLRSDIDEGEEGAADRKAMDEAMGKSPEQARVDEIRRQARADGKVPDQTPDPFIILPSGRRVPNPDAIGVTGTAPVLEQEKQAEPTIRRPGTDQGISERGDPSGQGRTAEEADAAREEQAERNRRAEEARKEQDAERARLQQEHEDRKAAGTGDKAEADARKADAEAGTKREPDGSTATSMPSDQRPVGSDPNRPNQDPNAPPPPPQPEGLGEDQRRQRSDPAPDPTLQRA